MSEDVQTIVDSLIELWNTGNAEVAKRVYAADAERRDPNITEPMRGAEAIARYVSEVRDGYPDFTLQIDDVIAQGDLMGVHWTVTGTHRGHFLGIAPTGRRISIRGMSLERIENGKITNDWVYFDRLSLFEQLGVSPEMVQKPAGATAG